MWKRRAQFKYFLFGIVGVVLYCEWFVYKVQPLFWNNLECSGSDESCTKILFIADPQIEGERAVSFPLNAIFSADADRYLKSTFSVVLNQFKPHILVYLGDLMDQGSTSSPVEFDRYIRRLFNIFDVDYPVAQVWLPGDNDIGGENEAVKTDKLKALRRTFDQPEVIDVRNISFFKVNGITHFIPKTDNFTDDNLRMVVSHYPITFMPLFGRQVNAKIQPHIYFCAHDHISKYVIQKSDLTNRHTNAIKPYDDVLKIDLDQELYEIYVPTCSYRMGTSSIGYGAAVVENRMLRYNVFWSSTRFPYLVLYLVVLLAIVIYSIVYLLLCRIMTSNSKNVLRSNDSRPLLSTA